MKCIYCLEVKQTNSFTKTEHVLPQSFGKFKNNPTLNGVVCDTCNKYFGDNLELHLGRDTFEGISRFSHNVKKQHEFKSPGKQSRLNIRVNEGRFKGAYAYLEYSDREGAVIIRPVSQAGFKRADSGDYEYFPLDRIPEKDYLDKNFDLKMPKSIVLLSCSVGIAKKHLHERGIDLQTAGEEDYVPASKEEWECDVTGRIDQTIFRAIAKIGFNYLSYWAGSEFVIQKAFDPIRRFIRYGEKVSYPFVFILEKAILGDEPVEGNRRLGHLIILDKSKNGLSIVSKVSLFNWITYSVLLAKGYQGMDLVVRRGQFFNIANGEIYELVPGDKFYQQQKI